MELWLEPVGLCVSLAGVLVAALADAWLSRSVLVYLDAVEANVAKLVAAVRSGDPNLTVTGIDLKRDRGQDRARALKNLGWLTIAAGFGMQLAAAYLARQPA
jgi:hypothetical protein